MIRKSKSPSGALQIGTLLLYLLSIIIPSVASVFLYRYSRIGWRERRESSFPDVLPQKRRNETFIRSDSRNYTSSSYHPRTWPEFDCNELNGEPCSREVTDEGPSDDLMADINLSIEDRALFASASDATSTVASTAAEQRNGNHTGSTSPKIAFLFLSYGPMPLARLWERFFQGNQGRYSIYIHANPSFRTSMWDSELFQKARIRSEQTVWGYPQMVSAERRLLASALLDPSNQRFILLSDSCIALRPFQEVWEYLFSTNLSFVESVYDSSKSGQGRYNPSMKPEIEPLNWRKGSQWWTMTRKHGLIVVKDDFLWPKIQKFCRGDKWHRYCHADEHYIQTLLHVADAQGLANRSVTAADWSTRGSSPMTFSRRNSDPFTVNKYREMTDQNGAISVTRQGCMCSLPGDTFQRTCFLFLRKVEANALPLFLQLASELLGY